MSDTRLEHQSADWGTCTRTTELDPDTVLRLTLAKIASGNAVDGTAEWEAIGRHVIGLAERDAKQWQRHASEYAGEYVAAVVELLRDRPEAVISADSPWGLAVSTGRRAGQRAVGAEAACGLTARDLRTHRPSHVGAPRVVSLDQLIETIGVFL